jgi:hypothetical protein
MPPGRRLWQGGNDVSELVLIFPVIILTVVVLVGILSVFAKYLRMRDQLLPKEEAAAAKPSKPAAKLVAGPERPAPHRSLAA